MSQGGYAIVTSVFILITKGSTLQWHESMVSASATVVGMSLVLAAHVPAEVNKSFRSLKKLVGSKFAQWPLKHSQKAVKAGGTFKVKKHKEFSKRLSNGAYQNRIVFKQLF